MQRTIQIFRMTMQTTMIMIILKRYILLHKLKDDDLNINMICKQQETNLCEY